MDGQSSSRKKNFLVKTWETCSRSNIGKEKLCSLSKSKSWHGLPSMRKDHGKQRKAQQKVAPEGCFSVYVGPEKQRFAIKAKYANHPLFEMLLEDAESEYGYNSDGPILLPCEVDLFYKVLAEMESGYKEETYHDARGGGCGFACSPFNPTRRLGNTDMAKGYASYTYLTPSRFIKMNSS